jgi:hypothetical protein
MSNPVASIWIAMVKNFVSFFFESYNGRSIRLKQVCALGNTETASGIELIVNFRILLSLPCRALKPWAGTYHRLITRYTLAFFSQHTAYDSWSPRDKLKEPGFVLLIKFINNNLWWIIKKQRHWRRHLPKPLNHFIRCTFSFIITCVPDVPADHTYISHVG